MLLDALPEPAPIASLNRREGELRYVTQNFNDLQGLRGAALFSGLLLLFHLFPHGHAPWRAVLATFSGVFVLGWAWAVFMTRWYKERYGFVGVTRVRAERVPGTGLAMWLCFGLFAALFIFFRAKLMYLNIAEISVVLLLPKCFLAAPRSAATRLRRTLYAAATSAALGSTVYAVICPGSQRWVLEIWIWLWSMLLLGLYDHWLLGYLLGPPRFKIAESARE